MAIYSIPAVIGLELPFWVTAVTTNRFLVAVPTISQWILLSAWVSFLFGAVITRNISKNKNLHSIIAVDERRLALVARGSAVFCVLNYLYVAHNSGVLYFLQPRSEQFNDSITIICNWFVFIGIISSLLIGSRKYLSFFAVMLAIIFVAGDRTMVALVTAATLVVLAHKAGGARALLSGGAVMFLAAASSVILFGKPIYLATKNYFDTGVFRSDTTLDSVLISFEPFIIFSHLSYVMDTNVKIGFVDFISSVLSNILLVPSAFGLSTNLYNEIVQGSFSFNIDYGVAGSYLAHGWVVGGVIGVFAFYSLYAVALHCCDLLFVRYSGLRKVLIACAGAVLAFYVHRNGMDNLGSFMRQIIIAGTILAIGVGAYAMVAKRSPSERPA